jgi:hypothetical protein
VTDLKDVVAFRVEDHDALMSRVEKVFFFFVISIPGREASAWE